MSELEGRTAVVTGAGRGIGAATAVALAQAGAARILLVARTAAQLDETAGRVRDAGAEALPIPVDLLQLDSAARRIADAAGAADVLVNNAATVEPLGATARVDIGAVRDALTLNVVAPMALAAALLPGMLAAGWGRIVNVSSGVAAHPEVMVGAGAYTASKGALEAHTLNLAAELAGTGVTANVYRPGMVDTAMQEWLRSQDPAEVGALRDQFVHARDEGRLITPQRSAAALVAHLETRTGSGEVWDVRDPL